MMNDRYQNALDFLDNHIKILIGKFAKGGGEIHYNELQGFGPNYTQISEGCFVKSISTPGSDKVILECKMKKGSYLLIHVHPDYKEKFIMQEGILYDPINDICIAEGQEHCFDENIWHQPTCLKEALMEIHCEKV